MLEIIAQQLEQIEKAVVSLIVAIGLLFSFGGTTIDKIPSIDFNGQVIEFPYTDENEGEDLIIRTNSETTNGIMYVMVENKSIPQEISLSAFFGQENQKVKEIYELVEDISYEVKIPEYKTVEYDCSYSVSSTTSEFIDKICERQEEDGFKIETHYRDEWQLQVLEDFNKTEYQDIVVDEEITLKDKRGFKAEKKIKKVKEKDEISYYKIVFQYPLLGTKDIEFFFEAIGSYGAYGHLDPFLGTWSKRRPKPYAFSSSLKIGCFSWNWRR